MSRCQAPQAMLIERQFYGELEAHEAADVETHARACAWCRQHMEDLRTIRDALATQPRIEAPPGGDWSGFMRRLNAAIEPPLAAPARGRTVVRWAAVAAMAAIAASAVLMTARFHQRALPAAPPAGSVAVAATARAVPPPGAADAAQSLVRHSEEHFERSKLVVLGLATRDPHRTRPDDWAHERELAGSLLPDTRLYRMTAEHRGMTDLARVLGDLETVLLQTSMSDDTDPQALERLQHLIARRDLVVKMDVVSSGI